MNYTRVVPRDLFNESKLLKCLAKISLHILDNNIPAGLIKEELENEECGFIIRQDTSSGDIFCINYNILNSANERIDLSTPLNCKSPWPLIYNNAESGIGDVLDDDGNITNEFLEYLIKIKNKPLED